MKCVLIMWRMLDARYRNGVKVLQHFAKFGDDDYDEVYELAYDIKRFANWEYMHVDVVRDYFSKSMKIDRHYRKKLLDFYIEFDCYSDDAFLYRFQ